MSFTHTAAANITTPAGVISGNIAVTSDEEISIDTTLTSAQVDKEVTVAFAFARLKSIAIYSDKALTIETNATDATGGDTLTLVANEPFIWNSSMLFANPFSENVTKFYLTNGVAATATVQIRILIDGTP